ncbi:MAG: alpha/beta hydrolase [Acidobacteriota bacterium]
MDILYMVHGMWGGPHHWDNYRTFFEGRGYRCITPVLRHHNVDPKDDPPPELGSTSLLDYAEDLEREVNTLDEPPILMGHSMGGLLVQMLAARGLGKKMGALTPASPGDVVALRWSVIKSFRTGIFRRSFWKRPYRQTFNEACYSMMHLLPPDRQRDEYDKYVYESGRAAFEIGFSLLDRQRASRVDETKIKCPMLIVGAQEDRITPASVVRKVAKKYGDRCEYKEFPGHAHWVLGEPGWEDVAGFVADWLER